MTRKHITPKLATTWEVVTYDVWGNKHDGYEVNDAHRCGEVELEIPIELNNRAFPGVEFFSAYPTDKQIREALDIKPRVHLRLDGDDCTIYVEHESTGYPLGELRLTSHESLSPIKTVRV